jgi:GcrA cell cycle regulator
VRESHRPVGGPEGRGNREAISMSIETWTPERVEQLKSCIVTGLTCSQIAAEIGVSRNAVIGKIHRLGLASGRPAGAQARTSPQRPRHPRAPTQRRLLRLAFAQTPYCGAETLLDAPVDSAHPCPLTEIAEHKCRWPIGDPARADFVFCGNDAITGFAYCAGHARLAYRVPARRHA